MAIKKKTVGKPSIRAKKSTYDGIDFDSLLEVYCYKRLREEGFDFEYTNHTYVLVNSFKCIGESYEADKRKGTGIYPKSKSLQSIKYTPDFVSVKNNWIIETKGRANELFPLRLKLFKKYLTDNNIMFDIYIPHNQKQVDEAIEIIKSKK